MLILTIWLGVRVITFWVSTYSTICDFLCPCLVVAYIQDNLALLGLAYVNLVVVWMHTNSSDMFLLCFVLKSVGGTAFPSLYGSERVVY